MDETGRSVDDKGILDTVRRILSEDQARAPETSRRAAAPGGDDDVFELEPAMMVDPAPAAGRPADPVTRVGSLGDSHEPSLVGGATEQATRGAVGSLRSALRDQRALQSHRGGPTIEDVVREEIRPLLSEWLDVNLPSLVERLVRSEIARIVEQGV